MPLLVAPQSAQLHVESIRGKDDVRRRLSTLGIVPGAAIALSGLNSAGVICDVAGSRIAFDKKTASKISVSIA